MITDAVEILRRKFSDAPRFRSLIHNRFIELNWWTITDKFSAGGTRIPGDCWYVFVMAGHLELYVGRL